jgi:hypothetical protein
MNTKALLVAAGVGTALQLAMVLSGHQVAAIQTVFMWGGLLISALAGAIYARSAGGGFGRDLIGGAVAGGACAFLGILVSLLLGDVPAPVLAFGTVGSAVTGAIGAALGRLVRRSA